MDEIEWAASILTAADREDIDRLADELMAELMVERGPCDICRHRTRTRSLNRDHDHRTGQLRGRLCWGCNIGLGHFGDDPAVLRGLVNYLVRCYPQLTPPIPKENAEVLS